MNINKFEIAGIGISIIAMSLALFLMRVESSIFVSETAGSKDTPMVSVVDSDNPNQSAAVADAVIDATSDAGHIERLVIDDVIIGSGEEANEGDTVSVHYIGTLQNGQQFDNSYLKGTPFEFTIGEGKVIEGWEKGLVGMKEGGQRILVIPPELGYGRDGFGPIPEMATLVFAVELLSIE